MLAVSSQSLYIFLRAINHLSNPFRTLRSYHPVPSNSCKDVHPNQSWPNMSDSRMRRVQKEIKGIYLSSYLVVCLATPVHCSSSSSRCGSIVSSYDERLSPNQVCIDCQKDKQSQISIESEFKRFRDPTSQLREMEVNLVCMEEATGVDKSLLVVDDNPFHLIGAFPGPVSVFI